MQRQPRRVRAYIHPVPSLHYIAVSAIALRHLPVAHSAVTHLPSARNALEAIEHRHVPYSAHTQIMTVPREERTIPVQNAHQLRGALYHLAVVLDALTLA